MLRSLPVAVALVGAVWALAAPRVAPSSEPARLSLVATIEPVAALVGEVGGPRVQAHALVPPGAHPHAFDPTPRDVGRIARADAVVAVGGDLDGWITRLYAAASKAPPRLDLLDVEGMDPLGAEADSVSADRPRDPHVWLDPIRVRDAWVPALVGFLAELDPAGAELFAQRGAALGVRLEQLDRELREILAGSGRSYVAVHPAWRYFGDRYGLEEIGVLETSSGAEIGPRRFAELVERARAAGVRGVLVEPQLASRPAATLASELGVPLVVADPLGDPDDPERSRYEALMRWNARAFARALGPGTP